MRKHPDVARHIYRADYPDREILPYLSPEYCAVCRGMFLEQLDYNLFHWVSRFPKFYFQASAGLDSHSMIFEAGSRQIQKDLRSPLRQCFRCGDRLEHADAVSVPDRRSGDNLRRPTKIAGPAASRCSASTMPAIMFLVLPDQKQIGVLLVPLYVFAGAGIWDVARLFSRSTWQREFAGPNGGGRYRRVSKVVLAASWRHGAWLAHGLIPIAPHSAKSFWAKSSGESPRELRRPGTASRRSQFLRLRSGPTVPPRRPATC